MPYFNPQDYGIPDNFLDLGLENYDFGGQQQQQMLGQQQMQQMPQYGYGQQQQMPQQQMQQPGRLPQDYFNFDTPNIDQFSEHLTNMPRREDHSSGILDKIIAGLSGAAAGFAQPGTGHLAARESLNAPYNESLQDWSLEAQSLGQLAGMDQQENSLKAQILQAIRDGDIERVKLMIEASKANSLADYQQGSNAARMAGVDVSREGLDLEGRKWNEGAPGREAKTNFFNSRSQPPPEIPVEASLPPSDPLDVQRNLGNITHSNVAANVPSNYQDLIDFEYEDPQLIPESQLPGEGIFGSGGPNPETLERHKMLSNWWNQMMSDPLKPYAWE